MSKNTLNSPNEGVKYDSGKPRIDLVPPEVILAMANVLGYGADKYSEHNWRLGMDYSRLLAAAQRHLLSWQQGVDLDDESGLPHLHHCLMNIGFLVALIETGTGKDDRYKTITTKKTTQQ